MAELVDPTIMPDDKNWTWVLDRVCGDCGFDVRDFDVTEVGELIRADATEWVDLLDAPAEELTRRPRPDKWSTLEYACHVRDVFEVYDGRLERMLAEEAPSYENWDQDATAVQKAYSESDPGTVAAELMANAEGIAARFDTVEGDQWQRTGHRSDGAEFTVETLARYFIHDPVHHLWDVRIEGGVEGAVGAEGAVGGADAGDRS